MKQIIQNIKCFLGFHAWEHWLAFDTDTDLSRCDYCSGVKRIKS